VAVTAFESRHKRNMWIRAVAKRLFMLEELPSRGSSRRESGECWERERVAYPANNGYRDTYDISKEEPKRD